MNVRVVSTPATAQMLRNAGESAIDAFLALPLFRLVMLGVWL